MPRSRKSWIRREQRALVFAATGVAVGLLSACLGLAGVVPLPDLGDAGAEPDGAPVADSAISSDGSNLDAPTISDAGQDALVHPGDAGDGGSPPRDAAVESGPPPVYSALNDSSKWTVFDVTTLGAPASYLGAVFDGRYIELVPSASNVVVRYDTQSSFTAMGSWGTYASNSGAPDGGVGFAGAAFDGQYVYFAPSASDNGNVVRYDTTQALTAPAAWTTFNAATANPNFQGFGGAVFDGRYVYFAPYINATLFDGLVTRYDTQQGFTATSSWTAFDVNTVTAGARGFRGGAFDGRYLYLTPFADAPFVFDGIVPRFDTQAIFTETPSWKTFDVSTAFDSGAQGFEGAVFDGAYVYFTPNDNGSSDGIVVRHDVAGTVTSGSSWESFDLSTVSADAVGFLGAAFDGRYVYLIPNTATVLVRYDTQAAFASTGSWATFDLSTVSGKVTEYQTAAFDGRYLYVMPASNGLVLRFDARTPAGLPPAFAGSFF